MSARQEKQIAANHLMSDESLDFSAGGVEYSVLRMLGMCLQPTLICGLFSYTVVTPAKAPGTTFASLFLLVFTERSRIRRSKRATRRYDQVETAICRRRKDEATRTRSGFLLFARAIKTIIPDWCILYYPIYLVLHSIRQSQRLMLSLLTMLF